MCSACLDDYLDNTYAISTFEVRHLYSRKFIGVISTICTLYALPHFNLGLILWNYRELLIHFIQAIPDGNAIWLCCAYNDSFSTAFGCGILPIGGSSINPYFLMRTSSLLRRLISQKILGVFFCLYDQIKKANNLFIVALIISLISNIALSGERESIKHKKRNHNTQERIQQEHWRRMEYLQMMQLQEQKRQYERLREYQERQNQLETQERMRQHGREAGLPW
jgi:hypothetical protein